MKLIEMVCTGNRGRSPVAELLTHNYLAKHGASDMYKAISSGSLVDHFKTGGVPVGFMRKTIATATGRSLYTPVEIETISTLQDHQVDKITHFYNKAVGLFIEEEEQFRGDVLPKFGIVGKVKTVQEQTVIQPNGLAVFSMAGSNNSQVHDIYQGVQAPNRPLLAVLSSYANDAPGTEIPNAFGQPQAVYEQAIAKLIEDVPKALDKLLV